MSFDSRYSQKMALKTLMTSGSEVALLGDMSFFQAKKNDEAKTVGSFANMP